MGFSSPAIVLVSGYTRMTLGSGFIFMSSACDATSPSPWAQSASKVEPPLLPGWGPPRTSVKGPEASDAHGPPSAGQAAVCPSVICSSRQGFFCFLFPQARNQYFRSKRAGGGEGVAGEEAPRGLDLATAHHGSLLQTEPSRLIQHKVAAEEILPVQ